MRYRILAMLLVVTLLAPAFAADVFYDVPLGDLKLVGDSKWPNGAPPQNMWNQSMRVVMDGKAEAYVGSGQVTEPGGGWREPISHLAVRAPAGEAVAGTMYIATETYRGPQTPGTAVHFTVAAKAADDARKAFYQARQEHYAQLQNQGLPGTAWFRYQVDLARAALGEKEQGDTQPWRRGMSTDDMYDLFSGGRAVAENLQLDRALRIRGDKKDEVKVDTIPGITVKEMDFAALLKGAQVKTDALAKYVPQDQYAVLFPSLAAVLDVMDRVDKNSVPVMQNLLPQSADAGILKRYQTQIGLHGSKLARLLGPQLVRSLAVTGSDSSFAMGTDLAILFDSPSAATMQTLLMAQISQNTGGVKGVRTVTENIEGIGAVQGFVTDDRTVSSYVASADDTVIVTNSLVQIRKLADLKAGKTKPLAELPEYQFFRSRYEIGKGGETAFLVISDATIRKWCSARWRIADARRIRELAIVATATAANMDNLVAGKPMAPAVMPTTQGDNAATSNGEALTNVHGVAGFIRPVAEMEMDTVTKAEADAYAQWRDGYQQNWSGVFDPIGLRLTLSQSQMGGDLTIMPLIGSTDYRQFINVTEGAALSAGDGDPHGALWHLVLAINRDSQTMRNWGNLGKTMLPGVKIDPLAWLGHSVALYADDDAYWKELAAAKDPDEFMQKNFGRLPIALRAEASSSLKLAAFISAVRALIEQSAPGLTEWQPQEYNGKTYVQIKSKQGGPDGDFSIYYAALPDSLTVTLNENVLKHALDRAAATTQPTDVKADAAKPATRPWLGKNLAVQVRSGSMDLFSRLAHDQFGRELQRNSWNNLAILNEWKRLYPDKDPVALHEQVWGVKLLCPAGGQYLWNKDLQTMESTVVGCPDAPKAAPESLLQLRGINFANFGLTFENQGLRAQVELDVPVAK